MSIQIEEIIFDMDNFNIEHLRTYYVEHPKLLKKIIEALSRKLKWTRGLMYAHLNMNQNGKTIIVIKSSSCEVIKKDNATIGELNYCTYAVLEYCNGVFQKNMLQIKGFPKNYFDKVKKN